jgi:FG-GAP repeat
MGTQPDDTGSAQVDDTTDTGDPPDTTGPGDSAAGGDSDGPGDSGTTGDGGHTGDTGTPPPTPAFASVELLSAAEAHVYSTRVSWYASLLTGVGDATGDGLADVLSASTDAEGKAGGGYLVPSPVLGEAAYEDVAFTFLGSRDVTNGAGRSIGVADLDGDGVGDVGFGAPYDPTPGMYVALGPIAEDRDLTRADLWLSCPASTYCGHGADLADVSGDGVGDAVVGAYYDASAGPGVGVVYVQVGPITANQALDDTAHVIYGEAADGRAGRFLAVGDDTDGDGVSDLLIAAPLATGAAPASGIVYVVQGPGVAITSLADADARLLGVGVNGYLGEGRTLSSGDVDGDGLADVAAGSVVTAGGSDAGGAYLVMGPVTGDVDLRAADVVIEGARRGMRAGSTVAHGDIDGTGRHALLVGSSADAEAAVQGGGAWLFPSPEAGTWTTDDAEVWFSGDLEGMGAGVSAAFGDFDGDGREDLALGAYLDPTGASGGGGVFIFQSGW